METLETLDEEIRKEWKDSQGTKASLNSLRQVRGQMLEELLSKNDPIQESLHKGKILGIDMVIGIIVNL